MATLAAAATACVNSSSYGTTALGGSQFYVSKATLVADGNDSATLGLALQDDQRRPVPGVTVTFAAADCNIVQPASPTDANGLVTARISSQEVGPRQVTAKLSRGDLSTQLNRTVALSFTSAHVTDGAAPGTAFDVMIVVVDASGMPDPDYAGTVSFRSSDPLAVLPGPYTVTAQQRGRIVIPAGVKLYTAGVQTVQAVDTATGAVVAQESYVIKPGPATSLTVFGPPPQVTAGVATQAQAVLYDVYHNIAQLYTGTLVVQSSDANARFATSHTFTAADQGNYTFAPVVFGTVGSQTLRMADPASAQLAGSANAFIVVGADPQSVAITTAAVAQAGVAGVLNVAVVDQYGNPSAGFTGTIDVTVSDANAGAPSAVSFVAGQSDLDELMGSVTWLTVGQQTITAEVSSGPHVLGAEQTVTVTSGPLASFSVTGPAVVIAGQYANLQVTARDRFGNVDAGYTGTARFFTTSALAVMPVSHAFTAGDAGVYAFAAILSTSGNQTFSAVDSSQPSLAGNVPITVEPNVLAAVRVVTMPAALVAGGNVTLTIQPVDRYGNIDTAFTGMVTIATSDGASTAPASYTFMPADLGSHSFTGVSLRTAGNQNFTATVAGSAPVIAGQSNDIVVTAAAPMALTFVQSPGAGQTTCAPLGPGVAVAALDSFGNRAVATDAVVLSLAGGSAGAHLTGAAVGGYDIHHVANFNDLAVSSAGAGYMLVASNANAAQPLTPAMSPAFSVSAGALSLVPRTPTQTGACMDVPYTLTSACPVDLRFEVDPNNSGAFTPMRLAGTDANHQGVQGVQGSGVFTWDSTADLPVQSRNAAVIRVHADDGAQTVTATISAAVDNAVALTASALSGDTSARCVAAADLNHDGAPDLVSCNGSAVNVRLNTAPASTPGAAVGYPAGFAPQVIAVADLNRDGKMDVFVADGAGHGAILPGSGNGTLGTAQPVSVPSGVVALVLADVNHDGFLDSVTALGSQVAVQLQSAGGIWGTAATTSVTGTPTALAVADVNRDGWLDAVVGSTAGAYTLLGSGTGLGAAGPLASGAATSGVALADVNHDGSMDIVAALASGHLSVYLGSGGSFGAPLTVSNGGALANLVAADLDNDGWPDLLGVGGSAVTPLHGDGTGNFAAALPVAAGGGVDALALADFDLDGYVDAATVQTAGGTNVYRNSTAHRCGWGLEAPLAAPVPYTITRAGSADFNEDGKPDLLSLGNAARLAILLTNDGAGHFASAGGWFTGADPRTMDMADFNGDGHADVVIPNAQDGTLMLLAGDGTGNFNATFIRASVPINPVATAHGVFFGDGKQSLAVAGGTDQGVQILHNRGDATFLPGAFLSTSAAVSYVVAADVNQNGNADLVIFTGTTATVYWGSGRGSFIAGPASAACAPADVPVVQDLDDDTVPDLAILCSNNEVQVWTGDGSGAFSAAAQVYPAHAAGMAAADFNGDGYVDFATGGNGRFSVALLQSNLSFTTAEYATLENGAGMFALDADADGAVDVVTLHPGFAATSLNNGHGVFTATRTNYACNGGGYLFALADINADGNTDLINTGCGRWLNVNLGTGSGSFAPTQYFPANTSPRQVGIADLNHDGWPDAVVTGGIDSNDTAPPSIIFTNTTDNRLFTQTSTFNVNGTLGLSVLGFGDLNNDGNIDAAIGDGDERSVYTFLGNGTGGFATGRLLSYYIGYGAGSIFVRDLNADGNRDIGVIAPAGPGNIDVFLGDGGGFYNSSFDPIYNAAAWYAAGDFNHDGYMDLVATPSLCTSGACSFLVLAMGLPSGSFTTNSGLPTALPPAGVAAGDVNGDGDIDIIVIFQTSAAIGVLLGDGAGHFSTARYYVGDGANGLMNASDLNHDGKIDVVVTNYDVNYNNGGIMVRLAK